MTDRTSHLITFLGKRSYERVYYQWRNAEPVETALFPTALPRFLPEIRSASVVVTEESREKYWATLLKQWPADWRPEPVLIPQGGSSDELWTIFDRVVDAVPDDCRVVFDITHAFRSIPLISVLAVAYLWSARDIQLQALVYGAFEAKRGDPPVAPVFDLTPMVNLLEWLAAVERFRHHLDGEPLQRLLDQIQNRAYQDKAAASPPPRQLKATGNAVKRLTDALLLGRVREVLDEAPKLAQTLASDQLRDEAQRWAKPFSLLLTPLQELIKRIARGPQTDLVAHYHLAKFYCERRLYPLAITLLREWIISKGCQCSGANGDELFRAPRRKQVEEILGRSLAQHEKTSSANVPPLSDDWLKPFGELGLLDLWTRVPDIRNDIDHAGMREQPLLAASLIKNVCALFARADQLMTPGGQMPDSVSSADRVSTAEYETVFYSIGVDQPIAPDAPLPALPAIPRGSLVVIEGRAPIWRYAMAWHRLHGSPAGAIAVYDPRLGAVVVASHRPDLREGQVLDLKPPSESTEAR